MEDPNGLANLVAILDDQPFQNSTLSVFQIRTILENKGGFMPDEAVMWFREWQSRPAIMGRLDESTSGELARGTDSLLRLRQENERLRAALKPFADIAYELVDSLPDEAKNTLYWAVPRAGDLRRALKALEHDGRQAGGAR